MKSRLAEITPHSQRALRRRELRRSDPEQWGRVHHRWDRRQTHREIAARQRAAAQPLKPHLEAAGLVDLARERTVGWLVLFAGICGPEAAAAFEKAVTAVETLADHAGDAQDERRQRLLAVAAGRVGQARALAEQDAERPMAAYWTEEVQLRSLIGSLFDVAVAAREIEDLALAGRREAALIAWACAAEQVARHLPPPPPWLPQEGARHAA